MPADIRPIRTDNLEDLIHVLRGSSHGFIFQFDIDIYGFLALSRFWNFSYQHSFLSYVDGEPAGLVLNIVDPVEHEALTFYWGVLPQFRGRSRIALSLLDAYFSLLHRQGYARTDADESHGSGKIPGSPGQIHRKLGYVQNEVFTEIQTSKLRIPSANGKFAVRKLDLNELLPALSSFPGFRYWSQRPYFLRHLANSLEILGAFKNDELYAYTVLTLSSGRLTILDFRFKARDAGLSLLHRIAKSNYPPPYTASYVPISGTTFQLLDDVGFARTTRGFTSMTLDFSTTSSQFVRRCTS
jgi:hypothetical protein